MQPATMMVNAAPIRGVQPGPLQVGEAQPLVGDAALLEEQLPGCDGRTHDGDHQEDEIRGHTSGREIGERRCSRDLPDGRVRSNGDRQPGQVEQAEEHRDPLPAQIASGEHHER